MTDRDEDRFDCFLRTDGAADLVRSREQGRGISARCFGVVVGENEWTLCNPDRGQAGKDAEVACEAEAAWMGKP